MYGRDGRQRLPDDVDVPSRDELLSEIGSLSNSNSSAASSILAGRRIGPLAYAGFVPVYRTQLFDRGGRQRVCTSWGEQAIEGIKRDSVELVRNALLQDGANPEECLEAAGPAGAPFSYANAAVFTQEQMDRVVSKLKLQAREVKAKMKCFVTDSEWVDIDQALQETGTYANVFVSKAAGGDTGLHLAITLGSLRAAQVFVEEGCKLEAVNDDGVSAVDIFSDNFQKIVELSERIALLEENQRLRGPMAKRLTAHEKACLAQRDRVVAKTKEYRLFAHGMACYFVRRLLGRRALEEEQRACEIDGRDMSPAAVQELRLCEVMSRYRDQCEEIRDAVDFGNLKLTPLDLAELESKGERFTGIFPNMGDMGGGVSRRGRDDSSTGASRTLFSAGADASLAIRMELCLAHTQQQRRRQQQHQQEEHARGDYGGGSDVTSVNGQADTSDTAATTTITTKNMVAAAAARGGFGGKGMAERTAAAILGGTGAAAAAETTAVAAGGAGPCGELSQAFQGRSLMSANWASKGGPGAAAVANNPRWLKPMTPGSWTASSTTQEELSSAGMGGGTEKTGSVDSWKGRAGKEGGRSRRVSATGRGKKTGGGDRDREQKYQARPFDYETPPGL